MKKYLILILLSFLIAITASTFAQSPYEVTNTYDSGPGSLRNAIANSNNNSNNNIIPNITFNIPGIAPHTINIDIFNSPLVITKPVVINGNTQPANGYNGQEPKIQLKKSGGLAILELGNGNGVSVSNVTITEITFFDTPDMININSSSNNNIINCVFYNTLTNHYTCIDLHGNSDANLFQGNFFGVNRSKSINSPKNFAYIQIWGGNSLDVSDDNLVLNNYFKYTGVYFQYGDRNKISNNIFVGQGVPIDLRYDRPNEANEGKREPQILSASLTGSAIQISGITTASYDYIEVYKSDVTGRDAAVLIGSVQADAAKNWTLNVTNTVGTNGINLAVGDIVIALATDLQNNSSQLLKFNQPVSCGTCNSSPTFTFNPSTAIINQAVTFNGTTACSGTASYLWDFGDPSSGANNTSTSQNPVHTFVNSGSYSVKLTVTISGCPSTITKTINVINPCPSVCPNGLSFTCSATSIIRNQAVTITNTSVCNAALTNIAWEIKEIATGTITNYSSVNSFSHVFSKTGYYVIKLSATVSGCNASEGKVVRVIEQLTCENCIGSFAPEQGKYVLSAWVREDGLSANTTTNNIPEIKIYFHFDPNNQATYGTPVSFKATGEIIDGWKRIEKEFDIPIATYIVIELNANNSSTCYFDDIRLFPKNAYMISYAYDPTTLKLMAELDERNFATFYEYNEEGKLIRTKKETEKGIMTINEYRTGTIKKN